MHLCVWGINFDSLRFFLIGIWYCSDSVVLLVLYFINRPTPFLYIWVLSNVFIM